MAKTSQGNESDLSIRTAERLIREIRCGRYRHAVRLPAETAMADTLNVSRTVIRDALAALEMKGYIGRKRGVGTVVNRHVLAVKNRVDLEDEFMTMIRHAGCSPELVSCSVSEGAPSPEIAGRLKVGLQEELYMVEKQLSADGTPAIYCIDYIPKWLIWDPAVTDQDLQDNVFSFLQRHCGEQVIMGLSELHAVNADDRLADKLGIRKNDAVLQLKEVRYNFDGVPILFSDEYYREGLLTQVILRKNIGSYRA